MMKLYIEIESGLPKNHPALEENLIQAFGCIPNTWVSFERIERPSLNLYETVTQELPKYELSNGIYKDVWSIRPMTEAEKVVIQQHEKDRWAALPNRENFTAWTFDEATCSYISPVPKPDDGKLYRWDGNSNTWVERAPPTII